MLLADNVTCTRRTGCIFCFVNSKVNIGRIGNARVCLTRRRKHVNMGPLLFASFPITDVTAAFSTAGSIASSSTTKATLTANTGACGNTVNVSSGGDILRDITRETGGSNGGIKMAADIDMSRTAPTTFCTRRPSHNVCCRVTLSLPGTNFSFCTNNNFLGPAAATSGGRTPDVFPVFRRTNCAITENLSRCGSGSTRTSGVVLVRGRKTRPSYLPCTVSHRRNSLALTRVARDTVSFLAGNDGGNFFLVIRNKGVS